jgi:hypothetical protein
LGMMTIGYCSTACVDAKSYRWRWNWHLAFMSSFELVGRWPRFVIFFPRTNFLLCDGWQSGCINGYDGLHEFVLTSEVTSYLSLDCIRRSCICVVSNQLDNDILIMVVSFPCDCKGLHCRTEVGNLMNACLT